MVSTSTEYFNPSFVGKLQQAMLWKLKPKSYEDVRRNIATYLLIQVALALAEKNILPKIKTFGKSAGLLEIESPTTVII